MQSAGQLVKARQKHVGLRRPTAYINYSIVYMYKAGESGYQDLTFAKLFIVKSESVTVPV